MLEVFMAVVVIVGVLGCVLAGIALLSSYWKG